MMMKRILLCLLLLVGGCNVWAQQTVVNGIVTDKSGNPIPGAKVSAKGSTESTLTELDGTFRLDVAKQPKKIKIDYVGMQSHSSKVLPGDMQIELSKTNWWNRKPLKYSWIISAQAGFPESQAMKPSFGLMVGMVKNFGWYVKGLVRPGKSTDFYATDGYLNPHNGPSEYAWTTGNSKSIFYSVSGGAIFRLGSALHFYFGAGYVDRKVAWEMADGTYVNTSESYSEAAADFGLMLRIGKVMVNAGTLCAIPTNGRAAGAYFIGNVGVGVCF